MNVTEVLLNLDVVSQTQVHDKLITDGANFNIRYTSYIRSIARWWYDETRTKNYEALRSLFGHALNLAELLIFKNDNDVAERILNAVAPALKGVCNLSQTYRDDVEGFAKFTRLVKDVEADTQKIRGVLERLRNDCGSDNEPTSTSPSSAHNHCSETPED